ncbi:hypothetical protein ISP15_16090 [Dyella jejuensis]|uniref:Uncharacterized protein n=1 Tax=Dyella jejuensis TaxID=1432009 RepID=A0ABW8JL95_9GAMM
MKGHSRIIEICLFSAYCFTSMLCGALVLHYRGIVLSILIATRAGKYYAYATPAAPFVLLSFLFVYTMNKIIDSFGIDRKMFLNYSVTYVISLILIYYYAYMHFIGHAENIFPHWFLFLIPPLMPAYTIAFSGNFFLFMRWDAALALHLFVYVFAFGIPNFGIMAIIIYIPFNVSYYAAMIWWSRKSLWPSRSSSIAPCRTE